MLTAERVFNVDGDLRASTLSPPTARSCLPLIDTRDAGTLPGMMRQALDRWHALRAARGAAASIEAGAYERDPRHPELYPTGGLVLKQTLRDLPR
ncbi:MAG TPA: hypothetical protein VFX49_01550, partial [Chloroflexota bacterium]|nr:hypothetical protein [Chloroflexota bacterium]